MLEDKTDWNDFLANWNGDKPSLVEATGQLDYPSALLFLYGKGARHPDMDRYGITDAAVEPSAAPEAKQGDGSLQVMEDSKKVLSIEKAQSGETAYGDIPDEAVRVDGKGAIAAAMQSMFKEEKHEFSVQEIVEKTPEIGRAHV